MSIGYVEYFSSLPCAECKAKDEPIVDFSTGDVVCPHCGVVRASHLIDTRSEEHVYQEDRERGAVSTRTSGFDTANSYGSEDIVFVATGAQASRDLALIERAQRHMGSDKHVKILTYLRDVNDQCGRLQLSGNIKEQTIQLCTNALQNLSVRKADKDIFIAACIYIACRMCAVPRLLDEIARSCFVNVGDLRRIESSLVKKLSLTVPPVDARAIANRFISRLRLWKDYECTNLVFSICEEISTHALLEGVPPQTIVATAVLWVVLLFEIANVDATRICDICFVTLNTLKSTFVKFFDLLDVICPAKYLRGDWKKRFAVSSVEKIFVSGSTVVRVFPAEKDKEKEKDKEMPIRTNSSASSSSSSVPSSSSASSLPKTVSSASVCSTSSSVSSISSASRQVRPPPNTMRKACTMGELARIAKERKQMQIQEAAKRRAAQIERARRAPPMGSSSSSSFCCVEENSLPITVPFQ